MEAFQRFLMLLGFVVFMGAAGLGFVELANKLRIAEHLRPTYQPIVDDKGGL